MHQLCLEHADAARRRLSKARPRAVEGTHHLLARIDPLKDAVYGSGEPTGEAHANMKAAMVAAGIFRSGTMRPPTVMPSREELRHIEAAVAATGLERFEAAE